MIGTRRKGKDTRDKGEESDSGEEQCRSEETGGFGCAVLLSMSAES